MTYTIYNLAEDCGVSVATISRVINGSDKVSEKTREKVLAAMKAHNYTPNVFARGMNKMSTGIVAVFISDIANPFFAGIVKGLESTLQKKDIRIILCTTNNDMEHERREMELMMQKQVDGFIIAGSRPMNDTNIDFIRETSRKYPTVLVNSFMESGPDEKLYSIRVDEKKASEEALEKILPKYGNLYMFGDEAWRTTKDKEEAAFNVAKRLGIEFDESHIFKSSHDLSSGRNAARNFLLTADIKKPCLIFCVSDQIAIGVSKELSEEKIKIPEEMGVLGFSDIPICTLVTPTISTVNQHIKEFGEQAAELFIAALSGATAGDKEYFSEYNLVERESTIR
jgi:LacI family transcriptional regulator